MSIFGDKSSFAIECQISRVLNGQTYAHLRLWVGGKPIGDYEDEIILSSCISYLSDFLKFTGNRYEPDLDEKSKEEVFQLIFDSVVDTIPTGITTLSEMVSIYNSSNDNAQPLYDNIERRFHLDSFGMSSFSDKFNLILVETKSGKQRLIWRTLSDMEIHEALLKPKSFEAIANQFLVWAESQINE
jgi:predicted house-cleaning noncanonical NTP pyrophosphatase (MazG superfamily)